MAKRDAATEIRRLAGERILVLDGAWGTLIHGAGLSTADYTGSRFVSHPVDVTGDPDILNLTRPDFVADAHRRYLDAGADINESDKTVGTALTWAAYYNKDDIVATLLARGADPNARNNVGGTPLMVAAASGNTNITQFLLDHGADTAA